MPENKSQSVVWTRVEDGLPKLSGRYLVTEEYAYMRIVSINTYLSEYVAGCFADKKKYSGAGFYENTSEGQHEKNEFVIAWAELPDAYMEDMWSMQKKYGVEFQFCSPEEAGRRVLEILEGKGDR